MYFNICHPYSVPSLLINHWHKHLLCCASRVIGWVISIKMWITGEATWCCCHEWNTENKFIKNKTKKTKQWHNLLEYRWHQLKIKKRLSWRLKRESAAGLDVSTVEWSWASKDRFTLLSKSILAQHSHACKYTATVVGCCNPPVHTGDKIHSSHFMSKCVLKFSWSFKFTPDKLQIRFCTEQDSGFWSHQTPRGAVSTGGVTATDYSFNSTVCRFVLRQASL